MILDALDNGITIELPGKFNIIEVKRGDGLIYKYAIHQEITIGEFQKILDTITEKYSKL